MRFTLATVAAVAALFTSAAASEDRMVKAVVKRGGAINDIEILNYALTLEYLERDFYAAGLAKFSAADFAAAGFSATVYSRFQSIASQEATHVSFLAGALGSKGVGECKYNFPLNDVKTFLATSLVLEGVGTSAYLGAAPDITEDAYLSAAGAILTVEARHSSYLNELNGISGFPNPYDAALTYSQVYTLAAQFIVPGSCGTSGSLPPGIHAYPTLKIKTNPPIKAGDTTAFMWQATKGLGSGAQKYYAVFINALSTTFVQVSKSGTAKVPAGLVGTTYVLISNDGKSLTDSSTVAGPAVLLL